MTMVETRPAGAAGPARAAKSVQAGVAIAPKLPGGETASWSLYFFFRILTQVEMDATRRRLEDLVNPKAKMTQEARALAWEAFRFDIAQPRLLNAGLVEQEVLETQAAAAPAGAFLDWLKVLVSADSSGVLKAVEQIAQIMGETTKAPADISTAAVFLADATRQIERFRTDYAGLLGEARQKLGDLVAGGSAGLVLQKLVFYELLRQGAPAFVENGQFAAIRSEAQNAARPKAPERNDHTPVNIAFTFPGLKTLGLHPATLASFPDTFREGMAARARRLHDTGPSAPEHWEGELGLPTIHGYLRTGSALQADEADGPAPVARPISEVFWKALRDDVREFNNPVSDRGQALRFWIGLLFRMAGLEIVQIEVGQDPYAVDEHGHAQPLPHRYEHFGFRDGLSQPFVDLGLGTPPAGGGTPSRASTWSAVAPGEIFLDDRDEDGDAHLLPINEELREGATFMVFRKLEQDVQGFHTFLEVNRPDDDEAQHALGAQLFGRWRNGTPLVLSPQREQDTPAAGEAVLNDFRYGRDDPFGQKCPLGAHIRRTNPRDIGGGEARRHRILRRGISYGGALLPPHSAGDGEPRGILFVAANARIDLQFEVVQGDWINGGEFLGQAGLGRCPVTGANAGRLADSFLEAGSTAPVTGLQRYVTTRGGDYFFSPGTDALARISEGYKFPPDRKDVPFCGYSMGDAIGRAALDAPRIVLATKATVFAAKGPSLIRVKLPGGSAPTDNVVLVGRYTDVTHVLKDRVVNTGKAKELEFATGPQRAAAHAISRGHEALIGTDEAGDSAPARRRLKTILDKAWARLDADLGKGKLAEKRDRIVRDRLDAALGRVGNGRSIDLVSDLAVPASYGILTELYGTPGPTWLSEIAASYPFSRQHVGDLPPDWLAAIRGEAPADPGQTTMQFWSAILLTDLVGNFEARKELRTLSRQAGSELLNHLDQKLAEARAADLASAATLVDAIVLNESSPAIQRLYTANPQARPDWWTAYHRDAAILLLEIIGTTLAAIPLTFASVMEGLLKAGIDLSALAALPHPPSMDRVVYEADRLNPNVPYRLRQCMRDTTLSDGMTIQKGEYVAALLVAANLDPRRFPKSMVFWPYDTAAPGESVPRTADDYLLFGAQGKDSNKTCWGRNRVAMPVLVACMEAAARLQGLRRVAGQAGEPQKLFGITIGLKARFMQVAPKAS